MGQHTPQPDDKGVNTMAPDVGRSSRSGLREGNSVPFDVVVVGAGISGATVAEQLAHVGKRVLVIDSRSHIGGNCYDYRDKNGICVHRYGTHIFHTSNKAVWDYLSQFTKWHPYTHKVLAYIDGQYVPIPFNLNSLHQVFPKAQAEQIEQRLIEKFGFGTRTTILELRKSDDELLKVLADFVYEKVFLHYTLKQWGVTPEELDPSVTARVPVLVSREDGYFRDEFQAIPLNGYTAMIGKMLESPNIEVRLETSFSAVRGDIPVGTPIFFTGSIDEFLGYEFGELPYRSVSFKFEEYDREFFQSVACVNYPNDYDFTRIGEYKHFLGDKSPRTVVSFEFSSAFERGKNERCYPISGEGNATLYARYLAEARRRHPEVHFLGRLGDYRYYDMDKAVARALEVVGGVLDKFGE